MPVEISIITAVWNSEATIESCLDSVAAQDWTHREHILIDGLSTDRTLELVRASPHTLAAVVSEADHGIYDALNKGLALARGEVVGFLHSDDFYANPGVLTRVAEAFADPEVCAVYGDLDYVLKADTTKVVRHWKSSAFEFKRLRRGWMPPHPTLYVRREWYRRIGGFDTSYRIAGDYHSVLNLFTQPLFRAVYIPDVLIKMRTGGESNRSLKNLWIKSCEDLRALRQTGVGGYSALGWKNLSKIKQFV